MSFERPVFFFTEFPKRSDAIDGGDAELDIETVSSHHVHRTYQYGKNHAMLELRCANLIQG